MYTSTRKPPGFRSTKWRHSLRGTSPPFPDTSKMCLMKGNWSEIQLLQILQQLLLTNKGNISHKQAIEKAEREFEIYREREMKQLESDFDRAVKQLSIQEPK